MNVYFISGLGADKRAFKKIKLPDEFNPIHIEWIRPEKSETLRDYALLLSLSIDQSQPFVLLGLSLGGIMVTEMAKVLKPEKAIIISSTWNSAQLPWYFKLIGKWQLHNIIPLQLLQWSRKGRTLIFGTRTNEEKELISQILKDTDMYFLSWSINAVLHWKNEEKPPHLLHIHGTNDHVFPIRVLQPDISIVGGEHFMIFSKAEQINEILEKELGNL